MRFNKSVLEEHKPFMEKDLVEFKRNMLGGGFNEEKVLSFPASAAFTI